MQRVRELCAIGGEVGDERRPLGEGHEEDFIVLVNHREEAVDGALSGADLALHASARVEHDADADRQIRRWRDVFDRLGLPVFFNDEVVDGEIRYRPAFAVDDGRDHVDQQDADLDLSAKECAQEPGGRPSCDTACPPKLEERRRGRMVRM